MSSKPTKPRGQSAFKKKLFLLLSPQIIVIILFLQVGDTSLVKKSSKHYYTVHFQELKGNDLANITDSNGSNGEESGLTLVNNDQGFSDDEGDSRKLVEKLLKSRVENYAKAILKEQRGKRRRDPVKNQVNNWEDWINRENSGHSQKKLVCYYTAPTFEDRPFAVFPEQIDPTLCTHIIHGFARIVNFTIRPTDEKDLEYYNRTLKLKSRNKNLKILLTIGAGEGNNEFANMVSQPASRKTFIQECLKFLETYPFDGFDFDWEFPAFFGKMEERNHFSVFLQEFRNYTDNLNRSLILSAAVAAPKAIVDISYDIPVLARVLDFVSVMAYDFHYYLWYAPLTGPNAPLFKSDIDVGITTTLNTAWAARYWYQCGMPANKIIVGAPTYGHTYKLVDKDYHGYNALAQSIGSVGEAGYITYPEICQFLAHNETVTAFDNETQVPYAYNTKSLDWISYDNELSAKQKAKFVNDYDLGGIMIWCVNNDDAWRMCNTSQTTFPIINTYKAELLSLGASDSTYY